MVPKLTSLPLQSCSARPPVFLHARKPLRFPLSEAHSKTQNTEGSWLFFANSRSCRAQHRSFRAQCCRSPRGTARSAMGRSRRVQKLCG